MNKLFNILLLLFVLSVGVFPQDVPATIRFSIFDKAGEFVNGVSVTDLRISQDKKATVLDSIQTNHNSALDLLILIDTSVSQEKTLPDQLAAAQKVIDNLRSGTDRVGVISFSDELRMVQDLTLELETARSRVRTIRIQLPPGYIGGGIVAGVPPIGNKGGSTSLFSGLTSVIEAFGKAPSTKSRRAILVISDGKDTVGKKSSRDTVKASIEHGIPIFAIGIGDVSFAGVDEGTLKHLTSRTGGHVVLPKNLRSNDGTASIGYLTKVMRSFYEATFRLQAAKKRDALVDIEVDIINSALKATEPQVMKPVGVIY